MNESRHRIGTIHRLFLLSLFGMAVIILCIVFSRTSDYKDKTKKYYQDVSSDIRLSTSSNDIIDFTKISDYMEADATSLFLYYKIPNLDKDCTLMYRSKDVYTKVFVGPTLLYETSVSESPFYNDSPGNLWNDVYISHNYSGQYLTIEIIPVYDNKTMSIDSFYFGNEANIIIHYVHHMLPDIFVSCLMIVIGCVLIIINLVSINRRYYHDSGLLFLGIYSFLLGAWCLLETNVVQFFVSDQRALQLVSNLLMISTMLPLFLYLDCVYNIFKNIIYKAFAILQIVYIYICIFAQLSCLTDVHRLLWGSHIIMFLGGILFVSCMIQNYVNYKKNNQDTTLIFLHMLGVLSVLLSAIFSFFRAYGSEIPDRAELLRVGSLFFILFFGLSTRHQTSKLILDGIKYKLVKNLAYQDGLTSLGNRTAYLEQIDSYAKDHPSAIGVVYLDVNNLKIANDIYGHEIGDKLIIKASEIINDSFSKYGKIYRIGGDEFCVFIEGSLPELSYNSAINDFIKMIEITNKIGSLPFDLSIAHGFSICNNVTREKLQCAIAEADKLMYKNKTEMKQNIKPKIRNKK